jgi:formate dehydrogenase maturation protein FdhE
VSSHSSSSDRPADRQPGAGAGSGDGQSVAARFARRAARAQLLAGQSAAAREALEFAAGLLGAQAALAAAVERTHRRRPLTGGLPADREALADELAALVAFAADRGPPGLRAQALAFGAPAGGARLDGFWTGDGSGHQDYLARAALRPYAEVLAALGVPPRRADANHAGCPFCAGPPWIVSRSGGGELEGARRLLGCALCGTEWSVNRISCPACGEQGPDKLPSFQSGRYPAARIEACATCRVYLKSIDLSVDGLAIPEVDDLCSLSLDLWASEEGYSRLEPGLAGL